MHKRKDCINKPRPCVCISCKHHMLWFFYKELKVNNKTTPYFNYNGRIYTTDDEIAELIINLPETCTLDVADRGEVDFQVVAGYTGLSRERIRVIFYNKERVGKIATGAIGKLRRSNITKSLIYYWEDLYFGNNKSIYF